MTPDAEAIDEFALALEADGMQLGSFDMGKLLQQICHREPPATADMGGAVLTAIRRSDLSLRDRAAQIVPVLSQLAESFETIH